MEKVVRYKKEFEIIIRENKNKKRLSELLSEVAYEFNIPLIRSKKFIEENKEVMALFEEIRGEIFKL